MYLLSHSLSPHVTGTCCYMFYRQGGIWSYASLFHNVCTQAMAIYPTRWCTRSRGAGHNCLLLQNLWFSPGPGSQPLTESTVRSSRSCSMRKDKPEAKGDPSAVRAVPSPTRHSPTAPKVGQASDRIHQPSGDHQTG